MPVPILKQGAILIATVQILPQILQENYGYNAELAGLSVSPARVGSAP